jgi:26S proteasome regulatory subunit N2
MIAIPSIRGVLHLLNDQNDDVLLYALNILNEKVDIFWSEISENLIQIEEIFENRKNPKLTAQVASKVYFHLAEYNLALIFALRSQDLFDLNLKTEYVETMICILEIYHSEMYSQIYR